MGDRLGNRIGHILFDIKQKKMIPSFAKSTENHLFRWFLSYFDTQKVGVAGSFLSFFSILKPRHCT
jgi:hypothetical protein